jgi:catechol 2,3-dioxygenase-like lactoylglutathione lyase family enzyme
VINHISIGVQSIPAAKKFYDATLGALGYRCWSEDAGSLGYGKDGPCLWLLQNNQVRADEARHGVHLCFDAPSRQQVNDFHAAGLKAGGKDNGAPGIRADYSPDYYAAFLTDPDGYRIEAYSPSR